MATYYIWTNYETVASLKQASLSKIDASSFIYLILIVLFQFCKKIREHIAVMTLVKKTCIGWIMNFIIFSGAYMSKKCSHLEWSMKICIQAVWSMLNPIFNGSNLANQRVPQNTKSKMAALRKNQLYRRKFSDSSF